MKENNILLAKFIGGKTKGESSAIILKDDEIWTPKFGICHLGDSGKRLKFNSDWNWLMLVVEKIETLPMQPEFFVMYDNREEFKGWYWNISVRKLFNKDCLNRESTKIIAYYNACIEFVKWYNDNK